MIKPLNLTPEELTNWIALAGSSLTLLAGGLEVVVRRVTLAFVQEYGKLSDSERAELFKVRKLAADKELENADLRRQLVSREAQLEDLIQALAHDDDDEPAGRPSPILVDPSANATIAPVAAPEPAPPAKVAATA